MTLVWSSLWRENMSGPTIDGFIASLREARNEAGDGEKRIINMMIGALESSKGKVWSAIPPRAKAWFKRTVGENPAAFGLRVAPARYRGNAEYVPTLFSTRLNIRISNEERQALNDYTKEKKLKNHSDAIRTMIRTVTNPLSEELLEKGKRVATAAAKGAIGGAMLGPQGAALGAATSVAKELISSNGEGEVEENPHNLNMDLVFQGEKKKSEGVLSVRGVSMNKAVVKEVIKVQLRHRKTGKELHRSAIDPHTGKPVRWVWQVTDKNGKAVEAKNIETFQVDPDTGKAHKIEPEEPNIGGSHILEINQYLPASDERRYLTSEIYEVSSQDPSEIKSLWRIASFLKENNKIGVAEVVFRKGVTRHGVILIPLISKKKPRFGLLMKVTSAKFPLRFPMKVPSLSEKAKKASKIKRKKLFSGE